VQLNRKAREARKATSPYSKRCPGKTGRGTPEDFGPEAPLPVCVRRTGRQSGVMRVGESLPACAFRTQTGDLGALCGEISGFNNTSLEAPCASRLPNANLGGHFTLADQSCSPAKHGSPSLRGSHRGHHTLRLRSPDRPSARLLRLFPLARQSDGHGGPSDTSPAPPEGERADAQQREPSA